MLWLHNIHVLFVLMGLLQKWAVVLLCSLAGLIFYTMLVVAALLLLLFQLAVLVFRLCLEIMIWWCESIMGWDNYDDYDCYDDSYHYGHSYGNTWSDHGNWCHADKDHDDKYDNFC